MKSIHSALQWEYARQRARASVQYQGALPPEFKPELLLDHPGYRATYTGLRKLFDINNKELLVVAFLMMLCRTSGQQRAERPCFHIHC